MDALGLPSPPASGGNAGIYREPFELFLIQEGRLLDDREFEVWMELFTEDGLYRVPSTSGLVQLRYLCFFAADCIVSHTPSLHEATRSRASALHSCT